MNGAKQFVAMDDIIRYILTSFTAKSAAVMPPRCLSSYTVLSTRDGSRRRVSRASHQTTQVNKISPAHVVAANGGRRAMVNNLLCRKLLRIWHQKSQETPSHGRAFSEPCSQPHIARWYLVYRWLIALCWISIIVCSFFELGSFNPIGKSHLWPIYLTNWDLTLGTTQALLGLHLVSKRWNLQKSADFDVTTLKCGIVEKIYWCLYTITSSLAIGVTGIYWTKVYDPRIHPVDPLNIMLHVCNSLLMLIDLCVTSIPLKFRHCWWSISATIFYLLFTVVYYSAGGVDKKGHRYIYAALDWSKPEKTSLICLGGLIFLLFAHCLLCYIARLRDKIYNTSSRYLDNTTPNEEQLKVKPSEIV